MSSPEELDVYHLIVEEVDSGAIYKTFIDAYIKNKSAKFGSVLDDYRKNENGILMILCSLDQAKDHWIALGIKKSSDTYQVVIKGPNDCKVNLRTNHKWFLKEIKNKFSTKPQFPQNIDIEHVEQGSDFAKALNNIEETLKIFSNQEINVIEDNPSIYYDKLVIEYGISSHFKTKDALSKILVSLKTVIEKDETYHLPNKQFLQLIQVFVKKNFAPRGNDKSDLRKEVLSLITLLKERGQPIFFNHLKYFRKKSPELLSKIVLFQWIIDRNREVFKIYYKSVNKNYMKKITDFDDRLKSGESMEEAKGCLILAISDWLGFSVNICKFNVDAIEYSDIEKVLTMFSHAANIDKLETKMKEIGDQLEELQDTLNTLRDNKEPEQYMQKFEQAKTLDCEFLSLRKQKYYSQFKMEIAKEVQICTILNLLLKKIRVNDNTNVDKDILRVCAKVLEELKDESLIVTFLKIVLSSRHEDLDAFPKGTLKKLGQTNAELVLEVVETKKVADEYLPEFLLYLLQILYENLHQSIRGRAIDLLMHHKEKLDEETSAAMDLEANLDTEEFLSKCLNQVSSSRKLTLNCFDALAKKISCEDTVRIIGIIVNNDVQAIPKTFLAEVQTCLDNLTDDPNVLGIANHLMCGKLIKLSSIKNLKDCIANEALKNNTFNLLHTAILQGQNIPEDILEIIKNLETTRETAQILRLLGNKMELLDILVNPKLEIDERKSVLEKIVENNEYHCQYTIEVIEEIIKYEPNLKSDAFKCLVSVLSENYSQNYSINFGDILKDIRDVSDNLNQYVSELYFKDVQSGNCSPLVEFLVHRIILQGEVSALDFLKTLSSREEAKPILQKYIIPLYNLILLATSDKVIQSTIGIINNCAGPEEILGILGEKAKKNFDNLSKAGQNDSFEILLEEVENGFILPDEKIFSIVENLFETSIGDSNVSILAKILLKIDENQGLNGKVLSVFAEGIFKDYRYLEILEVLEVLCKNSQAIGSIPDDGLQGIWKNILQSTPDYKYYCYKFLNAISGKQQIPNDILNSILEDVSAVDQDISLRILGMNILIHSGIIETDESIRNVIKTIALTEENLEDPRVVLLKKLAFQSLDSSLTIDETLASNEFLQQFYQQLKIIMMNHQRKLNEPGEDFGILDSYFSEDGDNIEKYKLLSTISNFVANSIPIDFGIFTSFEHNLWRRKLLTNELFFRTFQNFSGDETKAEEVLIKISELSYIVDNLEEGQIQINVESLLLILINNQIKHCIPFELLEDLLTWLTSVEALKIIEEDPNSDLASIHRAWIKEKLSMLNIKFSDEHLEDLDALLNYKCSVVEKVFNNLENGADIEDIKVFLKKVEELGLSSEFVEDFLCQIQPGTSLTKFGDELYERFVASTLLEDRKDLQEFSGRFSKLLSNGWNTSSVKEVIKQSSPDNLKATLDPLIEYGLREFQTNSQGERAVDLLKKGDKIKIHQLAVFQTFPPSSRAMKSLKSLEDEFVSGNPDLEVEFLSNKKFITTYEAVMKKYQDFSEEFPEFGQISSWSKEQIRHWSKTVKLTRPHLDLIEKIAVIQRGIEIMNGFKPREVQLLSALFLLNPTDGKGRLAQINTGEGKTIIVSILAVVKVLEGHKVDIITSSTELAIPQSIELKEFYSLFGITCTHNGKDGLDIKSRYQYDIVYGAASDFQGDILRDEYSKMGTRNGRLCDFAVVDEVDSMLIDGKNHIVMLSVPMPAMNHLETLLASIWVQLGYVASSLREKDGKVYFVEQENKVNEDGSINMDIPDTAFPITCSKEEFMRTCTEKHVRKLLRDTKNLEENERDIPSDYPEVKIPNHLRELVTEAKIKEWIDSAMHAMFVSKNGKHYIINDSKIVPVDAANTGVLQQNMHWSQGLHQFLQIKHGAKISPESVTTNFISNVTFFQRYGHQLYGLTGTMGSANAKLLLNKVYNVDSVIVPPFKKKRYQELLPIIVQNEEDWYDSIVESALEKLKNNRGVLIITKYIEETNRIYDELVERGYSAEKIKKYCTEADSQVVRGKLQVGQVIIATNIAGRGTDIKTTEQIENNGGLHVCVTFLPVNERVEMQNIGRTSRTGNNGTSQFVLMNKETNLEKLKKIRNQEEEALIEKAYSEIEKVTLKDKVFKKFCEVLEKVTKGKSDVEKNIAFKATEERFGFWLELNKKHFEEGQSNVLDLFNQFSEEILRDHENDDLIRNPYFYVGHGNVLLNRKEYEEAIDVFTKAINLDEHFSENAYYGRAIAKIGHYGGSAKKNKDQIYEAIEDLKTAKKKIEEREVELNLIQKSCCNGENQALSQQVEHKIKLFTIQKNAIDEAIGIDEATTDKEIKQMEISLERGGIGEEETKNIKEYIEHLEKTREERSKGEIKKLLDGGKDMEVDIIDIQKAFPEDEDINLYTDEIKEFEANGLIGGFKVKEIVRVDWWSVIGLLLLGLVQIIVGAVIAVFTVGAAASFGLGLISEGVGDLISAVKDGIINKDFTWESWGIQKAISLTISIICAGLKVLKDIAKTVFSAVKQTIKYATKAITQTVKEGWKLAAKTIGATVAKEVVKQSVNILVDYGIDKGLVPLLECELLKAVKPKIEEMLLKNENVKMMLEIDAKKGNKKLEASIKKMALDILTPRDENLHPILQYLIGVTKGICNAKIKGLDIACQTATLLAAIPKLVDYVPSFIQELEKKVNQLGEQYKKSQEVGASKTPAEEEMCAAVERAVSSVGDITSSVSESVATNMTKIITGDILKPVSQFGLSYGMDHLTKKFDQALEDKIENYHAERRIEFSQDAERLKRIGEDYNKGMNSKEVERQADDMINELSNGGQVGLYHMGAISDSIDRPIEIYNDKGKLQRIIGESKKGEPVQVEYHPNDKINWTTKGNKGETPSVPEGNDGIFSCIGTQVGKEPKELRESTVNILKENKHILANRIQDIERLKKMKNAALMLGSASKPPTNNENPINSSENSENSKVNQTTLEPNRAAILDMLKNKLAVEVGVPRGESTEEKITRRHTVGEVLRDSKLEDEILRSATWSNVLDSSAFLRKPQSKQHNPDDDILRLASFKVYPEKEMRNPQSKQHNSDDDILRLASYKVYPEKEIQE